MTWQSDMKSRLTKIKDNKSKRTKLLLFDSDKVDIIKYTEIEDEFGITRDGYKIIQKDFVCDVNDMSQIKKEQTWGYNLEIDKNMICRYNSIITEDCIVKYNDIYYKILKIKEAKNFSVEDFDAFQKIALIKNDNQNINIVEESEGDTNE